MLMMRSHLDVATPSRGIDVSGQAIDQFGRPVGQALVKLNAYRTQTDKSGRYIFHHVPAGEYTVSVDEGSLAADYKVIARQKTLVVGSHGQDKVDFQVVRLRSIGGHVYCGHKGDEEMGEGVALNLCRGVTLEQPFVHRPAAEPADG